MSNRVDYGKASPDGIAATRGLESYVRRCGLEPALPELVRLRASQINGCAYCVDMHTNEARAAGETEQRLYAMGVWEESPFFTERERAAPAWTEAATQVGDSQVLDALYDSAREYFREEELVDLILAIVAINGRSRLTVSFRTVPGTDTPVRRGPPAEAV